MEALLALSPLMARLLLLNNPHSLPLPNSRHMALNPRQGSHHLESSIKTLMDVPHTTSNILLHLINMELLPKTAETYLPHNINTSKAYTTQRIPVGYMATAPLHLYHMVATQAKILPKEAIMGNPSMMHKDNSDGNPMVALGLMA